MEKIVITGMGSVTPVGIGVENYWKSLISGVSGIDMIKSFDASGLPVRFAGEIKDFNAADYLSRDLIKNTDPFMQYAYVAAKEAIEQSKLDIDPDRTGVVMGTAMSGVSGIASAQEEITLSPGKKVGPRFMPKILGNIAAAHIAINYNIHGPSMTVSTACSSGGDAINVACMLIKAGKMDAAVVVGAESILSPLMINALSTVSALSQRNDEPDKSCRPFDVSRDGFVIGEGGGALIIETEESAKARGANIIAEICGCGNTCDAFHVMAPHPEGKGAIACIKAALSDAGIDSSCIGYINAHGTATHKGDISEATAIKAVFGEKLPLVSSTKSATGHMMGAGGITETIACIKAVTSGIVPPTLNLENVDEECGGVDFVPKTARKADVKYAMSNAFGFGGQNSSIIVGRYDG